MKNSVKFVYFVDHDKDEKVSTSRVKELSTCPNCNKLTTRETCCSDCEKSSSKIKSKQK